jgi:hypothetical protein
MTELVGNPYFHLETRKKQLERQRAELLAQAKAARELAAPIEGQMVSGHYVPNHWSAYLQQPAAGLANAVSQGMADRDERVAAEEEASAASAHMANMPSARTREVPGPTESGDPLMQTTQPTREEKIKWAQQGMGIPSLRQTLQKAMEDQLINEPEREEARAFRASESAAQRSQVRELRLTQLEQEAQRQRERLEDRGLDRQSRDDLARRHEETLRAIAQLTADSRRDVANISADARSGKSKPLSDKARADLDAYDASKAGLDQAISSLDQANDKGTGWGWGVISEKVPGGQAIVSGRRDKATKDAVQQLTYWTDAIRHDRFGSALTAGEKASAAQYLPSEYDSLDELKRKAVGIRSLLDLNHSRLKTQGANVDARDTGGASGSWGTPTQTTPTATKTINGKTYVKRNGQWYEQ